MAEEYKNESWLREKYWDEGKSQVEIADELDVCDGTVSRWMRKHNIERRSHSESMSDGNIRKLMDEEWLREQYKNKKKLATEIADELDVCDVTVHKWMERHNIETRSYAEIHSDGNIRKLMDEEWLKEQYENQEKTTYEIADKLEVSDTAVRNWMRRHGIEVRSSSEVRSNGDVRKLRDEEWLKEQYKNQRKSTLEIADELGVDNGTVCSWLERHGIETRSNAVAQTSEDAFEKLRDGEWLRGQYKNQQKSGTEIADELRVSHGTVTNWLRKHRISVRSSFINPKHTTHIVRSEWELEVCNLLIEMDVDYDYESVEIECSNGSSYVPDFATDEYIIEVKGAYFGEIHGHKTTEREKALAAIEHLEERNYVVIGKELPADIHIPWEERSKIRKLFSDT